MIKRLLALSVFAMLDCASSSGSSLRARSAGDMHCPRESVLIYRLDERSYRVVGCGQEFVYLSTCAHEDRLNDECTWVLNSHQDDSEVSPVAKAGGCSFDAQCKGERICVKHECVAPTAASAPATPTERATPAAS